MLANDGRTNGPRFGKSPQGDGDLAGLEAPRGSGDAADSADHRQRAEVASAAQDRCKHGYPVRDDDPSVQECIDREASAATPSHGSERIECGRSSGSLEAQKSEPQERPLRLRVTPITLREANKSLGSGRMKAIILSFVAGYLAACLIVLVAILRYSL